MRPDNFVRPRDSESYALDAYRITFETELNSFARHRRWAFEDDVGVSRDLGEAGHTGSAAISAGHVVAHPERVGWSRAEYTS